MRLSSVLPVLALASALALAGCVKDEPVTEAATDEDAAEPTPPPTPSPAPTTPPPSSPPPSSPPPASSSPPPADEQAPPHPPPTPRVEVFAWNGSITGAGAGASTPAGASVCCVSVAPVNENADQTFDVDVALQGIVVEVVWTDAAFDLDLLVTAPDYDVAPAPPEPYTGHRWEALGGAPGQPEGHTTIAITEAEALALLGTWNMHVSAKGPANAASFALYVSLFYDEAPASDYTAVPSGNP